MANARTDLMKHVERVILKRSRVTPFTATDRSTNTCGCRDFLKIEDGSLYLLLYRMERRGGLRQVGVSVNNRELILQLTRADENACGNVPTGSASHRRSREFCRRLASFYEADDESAWSLSERFGTREHAGD